MPDPSAAPAPVLVARGLRVAYPDQPPLLDDWSAAIPPGVTLLHGDTGSGKSTLLRVLAGLSVPERGELAIAGIDLRAEPVAFRRQVFLCDPGAEVDPALSGRQTTTALWAGDVAVDVVLWQALVDGYALSPHLDKPLYVLSTGSRRKLWLAAALAAGRALTLLDEPTAALDAASIRCLWATLGGWPPQAGRAVVVASGERVDRLRFAATLDLSPPSQG